MKGAFVVAIVKYVMSITWISTLAITQLALSIESRHDSTVTRHVPFSFGNRVVNALALLGVLLLARGIAAEPMFFSSDCPDPRYPSPEIEAAMKLVNEPSLYADGLQPAKHNSFRLTVTQVFSEDVALIVRLNDDPAGGAKITSAVFRKSEKAQVYVSPITSIQKSAFEKTYLATDFTPVSYPRIRNVNGQQIVTIGIRDGHPWLFESLVDGKYRCLQRSAGENGSFQDMGRAFLRLAGKDTSDFR